MRRATAR